MRKHLSIIIILLEGYDGGDIRTVDGRPPDSGVPNLLSNTIRIAVDSTS